MINKGNFMEKLYNITQKPIIKALISIIVPLVFGIISGIYVNSITVNGEVKILLSYKHLSFYILLLYTVHAYTGNLTFK